MNIPNNMLFTRLHPNDRFIYDQLKAMVDAPRDPKFTLQMALTKLNHLLNNPMHWKTEKLIRSIISAKTTLRESIKINLDLYDQSIFQIAPDLNDSEGMMLYDGKAEAAYSHYADRTNLPNVLAIAIVTRLDRDDAERFRTAPELNDDEWNLIDCMISTFGNTLEQACVVSHACLEELYSKCERIHDGHSTGSMMFTIILGNDAELTAKRNALSKMMIEQLIPLTHYKIHLDGNVLRANKEIV